MKDREKAKLLTDSVMRWFKKLEESKISADVVVRKLSAFYELNKTTPKRLKLADPCRKLTLICAVIQFLG